MSQNNYTFLRDGQAKYLFIQTEDPAAWIAANAAEAGFNPEGYTCEPSTYVEPTPPAPDPLLRLEADKAFGLLLVDSFVAGSRANGFDLAQTRIINALLGEVEVFLRRGSIGIARDALAEIEPMPLFPQAAKDAYISQIDQYLAQ